MKKIYLSGPITGRSVDEYRTHFASVEASIRAHAVVARTEFAMFNPTSLKIDGVDDPEWHDYMRACVRELLTCDGIAVLSGWEKSRGARFEIHMADVLHIPVVFLETPVCELDIVSLEQVNNEIYRYWVRLTERWARETNDEDRVLDRSLVEITHRYLDPHGFEYIKNIV